MKFRFPTCLILLLLGGCYDDTPNRMKVIDGETDRVIYARMILDAAAMARSGRAPDRATLEQAEYGYQQSQAAYIEILNCEDEGTCRRASLRYLCTEVAALLEARSVLAPHSELYGIAEQLSASRGPMTADRLQALKRRIEADGKVSALEADILTLATAAAAAHTVYALTPVGAREAERRRQTHAIDEFQLRCEAG
ncbi:MAG: hypothetical protein MUE46_00480 [Xanthomonadales bacterium]|nr:hypothetical protein [Xanthomonadales bacterium]